MVASAAQAEWQQGQDALRNVVGRVTRLLRSVGDPGLPTPEPRAPGPRAVGQWDLAEVAMHLSQAWIVVPGLARQDLSRFYEVLPSQAGVAGDSLVRDMWDLGETTTLGVRSDPERDLTVLANRIEDRAQEYLADCLGADPDAPRPWLIDGVTVHQSTLTYHLLSETIMHGYDIAHAAGRHWPIEPAYAAMLWSRLNLAIAHAVGPRTFVNHAKAAGVRATFDVRLRGGDSFLFDFDDGELRIEARSSGRAPRKVDCSISADPVAFLMVFWRRQSHWSAFATGKLLAWGRKPWLAPRLRSLIRNP